MIIVLEILIYAWQGKDNQVGLVVSWIPPGKGNMSTGEPPPSRQDELPSGGGDYMLPVLNKCFRLSRT